MLVNIKDIKINPYRRYTRFVEEKIDSKEFQELLESFKILGQLEPIIINDKYEVVAGFRRFKAANELGWETIEANMKTGLDALQEFDIELHENMKRRDLTSAEKCRIADLRKIILEEIHPELKKGAAQLMGIKRNEDGSFGKKNIVSELSSLTNEESKSIIPNDIKETLEPDKPIQPIAESTADLFNISKRQAFKYQRIGQAIREGKVDEEIVKEFEEEKRSLKDIMKEVKKAEKAKIIEEMQEEELPPIEVFVPEDYNTEIKPEEILPDIREIEEKQPIITECKKCSDVRYTTCPECYNRLLICNKSSPILKRFESEGCDDYKD